MVVTVTLLVIALVGTAAGLTAAAVRAAAAQRVDAALRTLDVLVAGAGSTGASGPRSTARSTTSSGR